MRMVSSPHSNPSTSLLSLIFFPNCFLCCEQCLREVVAARAAEEEGAGAGGGGGGGGLVTTWIVKIAKEVTS
jgi:hypothetical protein